MRTCIWSKDNIAAVPAILFKSELARSCDVCRKAAAWKEGSTSTGTHLGDGALVSSLMFQINSTLLFCTHASCLSTAEYVCLLHVRVLVHAEIVCWYVSIYT